MHMATWGNASKRSRTRPYSNGALTHMIALRFLSDSRFAMSNSFPHTSYQQDSGCVRRGQCAIFVCASRSRSLHVLEPRVAEVHVGASDALNDALDVPQSGGQYIMRNRTNGSSFLVEIVRRAVWLTGNRLLFSNLIMDTVT